MLNRIKKVSLSDAVGTVYFYRFEVEVPSRLLARDQRIITYVRYNTCLTDRTIENISMVISFYSDCNFVNCDDNNSCNTKGFGCTTRFCFDPKIRQGLLLI
jgi:hypothetical protein